MIGVAGEQGLDPVELLKQDQQSQLVLQREPGKGERPVRSPSKPLRVSVGTTYQINDAPDTLEPPSLNPAGKVGGGGKLTAFIEDHTEGTFAPT